MLSVFADIGRTPEIASYQEQPQEVKDYADEIEHDAEHYVAFVE